MLNGYNPFSNKECEETEHGVINYRNDMGTCYVTHRQKQHFFRKFQGFGISCSELEIAYNRGVHWVLIMYRRDDGTTIPYRIALEDVKYLADYNNEGDLQKIFPLKELEKREKQGWI